MNIYKADFHVHSVLSPCASLDMSPSRIIKRAAEEEINVLAITDHNSTFHCRLFTELGAKENIFILPGVELNSKEEIHCLAFFEDILKADVFQGFIDKHLPKIKNRPELFGEQFIVDENENILKEVEWLLISALDVTIDEIEAEVHKLNGIFIPAHIDRKSNSILSNLGFIPDYLNIDGVELSRRLTQPFDIPEKYSLIRGSDAHVPEDIGKGYTELIMKEQTFDELRKALKKESGRGTTIHVKK